MENCADDALDIIITHSTLHDDSIRYAIKYHQTGDLPVLSAVILDPVSRWSDYPIVSLEYRRPPREVNILTIYSALKLINAGYENRSISYLKNNEIIIDIVRITSNSIQAIAYLSNLYLQYSCEASILLKTPLPSMVKWTINKNSPSLFQDFGIWMAHLSEDTEDTRYYNIPVSDDNQCLLPAPSNNDNALQKLQAKISRVSKRYQQMSNQNKAALFNQTINLVIYEKVKEVVADAALEKIEKISAEAEFAKAQLAFSKAKLIFQNLAQCTSFLESKYPKIINSVALLTKYTQEELSKLDAPYVNVETFTKNTKDVTTSVGTLIFDVILKNIDILDGVAIYIPPIGYTLSGIKISTCVLSLFMRNNWLNFADKESSKKINKNDLI